MSITDAFEYFQIRIFRRCILSLLIAEVTYIFFKFERFQKPATELWYVFDSTDFTSKQKETWLIKFYESQITLFATK